MVEDPETLRWVAERFKESPVIGVDTESDSFYSYQEKVCLIQFSDAHTDYIVDPLAVPDLSPLAPMFADPNIVKVFHGADYDVVCLKRDFGFEIRNLFDTMIAAQLLAAPRLGLADLIGGAFGHKIDKQYQRYDWASRPLLPEHLDYARGDTHWLLAIRELLIRRLKKTGRLAHLEEECAILEQREWTQPGFDEDGYLRIKTASKLDDTGKRILKRLHIMRDGHARRMDRPSFKVLSDSILVDVARLRPTSLDALDDLFDRKQAMKKRFGHEMVDAVVKGLEDDFPIPKSQRVERSGPEPRVPGRVSDRVFEALKTWRNELCAKRTDLLPIGVAANGTLKQIAQACPRTLDELRELPEVRTWQAEWFGEPILKVVAANAKVEDAEEEEEAPRRRRPRRRS